MTEPALLDAVQQGDHARVRGLIAAGALPLLSSHVLLTTAIRRNDAVMVALLLEAGANVNAPGVFGATPLFDAAVQGDLEVGRLLLDRGAQPDAVDPRTGTTPLLEAALFGSVEFVELLAARGANLHAVNRDGHNAATLARFNMHDTAAAVCARLGVVDQPQFHAAVAETRAAIQAVQQP